MSTLMSQQIAAPSPKVTGGVLSAPLGTDLPVTSTEVPDLALKSLGRVAAAGLGRTEDRSAVDVQDWGGELVATLQEKYGITLKFNLIQYLNADVQRAVHGTANVSVTPATQITGAEIATILNAKLLDTQCWVFDGFYNLVSMRLVVPMGRISSTGEVKWVHNALASYDCTLKCFPDDDGNYGFQYLNDGVVSLGC